MRTTTVYLICFHPGIPRGQRPGNASHYLGSTSYADASERLREHVTGAGSPLVKAAHDRGLHPEIVATWSGSKQTERAMKRRHRLAHYCPRCGADAADTGEGRARSTMIGDEAELYRRLSPRLLRAVARQVRTSPQNVEDACHFAWVAFLGRSEHVPRTAALAWLTTTAVHEAYKLINREQRAASVDQATEAGFDPASRRRGTDDHAHDRQRLQLVRQLPDRQRRVLILHAAGLTYAEISDSTGETRRTVERELYRARSTLAHLEHAATDTTALPPGSPGVGGITPASRL